MVKQVNLVLDPESSADGDKVKKLAAKASGIPENEITGWRITGKSIDARQRNIKINLKVEIASGCGTLLPEITPFRPLNVTNQPEVIIIGAGPAGLFAALRLTELGLRPVVIERGRDVSARKLDIARITREHYVDPDSNYCFGEGGAGAFSDGKLYTRSHKRGNNLRVLELLCLHGANENILYESHPHIGSDKLPGIIRRIRESITTAGGIFLFETKVNNLIISSDSIQGVIVTGNRKFMSPYVILATGHSARDTYQLLHLLKIEMEFKPFALGVRVEHPQELIDRIQYHGISRGMYLPAATYNLVKQVEGRGVYSFCMCPGGFIVPSASAPEEVVVNGMSPSGRNSPFANSGIVTEIRDEEVSGYAEAGALAGLEFQKEVEHRAWEQGGKKQSAPAQRLSDFVAGKFSGSLPRVSYFPGAISSPLHEWLPDFAEMRLRKAFRLFDVSMKGFLTNEAVVVGVESRTSSPVRILRNKETLEHVRISGLWPCGEGAGYAGGILSSAVDGIRAAEKVALKVGIKPQT